MERNRGMMGRKIGILSLIFFLAGLLALADLNLHHVVAGWQEKIRIRVFLPAAAADESIRKIQADLKAWKEISEIRWVTPDQTLDRLADLSKSTDPAGASLRGIVSDLGENPLPHTLEISLRKRFLHDPTLQGIVKRLREMSGVDGVVYDRVGVVRLDRYREVLRKWGCYGGGMIAVSLLLLAVGVMRGVTGMCEPEGSRIRAVVRGIVAGAGGSALALLLLWAFYALVSSGFASSDTVSGGGIFFPRTWIGGGLIFGAVLGGIGGLLSGIRRTPRGPDPHLG